MLPLLSHQLAVLGVGHPGFAAAKEDDGGGAEHHQAGEQAQHREADQLAARHQRRTRRVHRLLKRDLEQLALGGPQQLVKGMCWEAIVLRGQVAVAVAVAMGVRVLGPGPGPGLGMVGLCRAEWASERSWAQAVEAAGTGAVEAGAAIEAGVAGAGGRVVVDTAVEAGGATVAWRAGTGVLRAMFSADATVGTGVRVA